MPYTLYTYYSPDEWRKTHFGVVQRKEVDPKAFSFITLIFFWAN